MLDWITCQICYPLEIKFFFLLLLLFSSHLQRPGFADSAKLKYDEQNISGR